MPRLLPEMVNLAKIDTQELPKVQEGYARNKFPRFTCSQQSKNFPYASIMHVVSLNHPTGRLKLMASAGLRQMRRWSRV